MKNGLFYSLIGVLLASLFAGCAPQLAQVKYGQEETQWKNYIAKSYREWEPPATPPPLSSEQNDVVKQQSSLEIVPAPADMHGTDFPQIKPIGDDIVMPLPEKGVDVEAPVLDKATTYTVKKGDTLWTISKKFYNNGRNWKNIQQANKDVLSSPEDLKAGMSLNIPAVK
jgi:nucleoid-associated protein YgaU